VILDRLGSRKEMIPAIIATAVQPLPTQIRPPGLEASQDVNLVGNPERLHELLSAPVVPEKVDHCITRPLPVASFGRGYVGELKLTDRRIVFVP